VGASEQRVTALDEELGWIIPASYRKWLRSCNGILAGPGGIYGTRTGTDFLDIETIYEIYPEWKSSKWLPVAGDGNGNHYVLDNSYHYIVSDAVYFVDVAQDSLKLAYIVASNLWGFLTLLLRRDLGEHRWPFNREFMLDADPDILSVRSASLLPWIAD
jgi:cell wall assembly regulator SMI1